MDWIPMSKGSAVTPVGKCRSRAMKISATCARVISCTPLAGFTMTTMSPANALAAQQAASSTIGIWSNVRMALENEIEVHAVDPKAAIAKWLLRRVQKHSRVDKVHAIDLSFECNPWHEVVSHTKCE